MIDFISLVMVRPWSDVSWRDCVTEQSFSVSFHIWRVSKNIKLCLLKIVFTFILDERHWTSTVACRRGGGKGSPDPGIQRV